MDSKMCTVTRLGIVLGINLYTIVLIFVFNNIQFLLFKKRER